MILVSRPLFVLFCLLASLAVMAMGIFGYLYFHPQHSLSALEAKLIGEWFLFGAICTTLLLLLLAWALFRAAPRINRELDHIVRTGSQFSLSSQLRSSNLGPLAGSLLRLYSRIAELNEKQSLKMSAQNNLITFLARNADAPLLVSDITGEILYTSQRLEQEYDLSRNSLRGDSVENFAPNVLVQSILKDIETRGSYGKERKGDLPFTVFPIYNRQRRVAYLLFDFREESPLASAAPREGQPEQQEESGAGRLGARRRGQLLGQLFGRFGSRREDGELPQ